MKKFVGIISAALVLVCLTGCSKGNELKCTLEEDGAKSVVIGTVKDGKITKMVQEATETYESEDELEQAYTYANAMMSLLGSVEGLSGEVKKDGLDLTMSMTMDLEKMSAEDIASELGQESITEEEFKKEYEEQGYTCK